MAKILIVDDDQAITTIFETALKNATFEVVTALDGQTGLEKAKNENPDLILLDQVLPDIKGNDVLKTLKGNPQTQHLKVVVLSNFGQNELVDEALSNGAIDYILKYQIEPGDLVNKVQQILGSGQTTTEPRETGTV